MHSKIGACHRRQQRAYARPVDWGTVIVAGLGIGGTVAAAAVSTLTSARLSRRDRRSAIYAETLASLWTAQQNIRKLSESHVEETETAIPPFETLRRLHAEVRLVGGARVREQLEVAIKLVNEFEHERFLPYAGPSEGRWMNRPSMSAVAGSLKRAIADLEGCMRAEVS